MDRFDILLDEEIKKHKAQIDFIEVFEAAMTKAGFDFNTESERLLEDYIYPALEELKVDLLNNEQKALDIFRESGLDEIKIRWRRFDTAKLNFIQKQKLKKIKEDMELLGDTQLHFVIMGNVIYKHRPELKEKYKPLEIWTLEGS